MTCTIKFIIYAEESTYAHRSLVSFDGKYLAHVQSFVIPHCQKEGDTKQSNHQVFKICIPHTEHDLFGPAFVEVCLCFPSHVL